MPFRALGSGPILRAIQELGYTEPTPIQSASILRSSLATT